MRLLSILLCFSSTVTSTTAATSKSARWHPGNYILLGFGSSDENVKYWLNYSPLFRGVQVTYKWKDLEPSKNQYDFSSIKRHMQLAKNAHKYLWVQIQYKGFSANPYEVCPTYLVGSPKPGGGNYSAFFTFPKQSGQLAKQPALWDPAVEARVEALLSRMGEALSADPNISALEGVNTPESTNPGKPEVVAQQPNVMPVDKDRSNQHIIDRAKAFNKSFPHTQVICFMNGIMPTASVPDNRAMVTKLIPEGIGFGGPDLRRWDSNLVGKVYSQCPFLAGKVSMGFAVQWTDTMHPSKGGALVNDTIENVRDTYALAKELGLNYVFWQNRPGYINLVQQHLNSPEIKVDPAGGLVKKYPASLTPYLN